MKWIKKIYDWTLSWAESPYSMLALFFLAFIEASFFIIPPDLLLIALCAGQPKKSLWFALVCSVGSVAGGLFGYYIGYAFFDSFGKLILDTLHLHDAFAIVGEKYQQNAALAIFTAAFTPIPYKVFTIAAGFFQLPILTFLAASLCGRSLRFFLLSVVIYFFGPKVREIIEKYFDLFTIAFTILLIAGFFALKALKG